MMIISIYDPDTLQLQYNIVKCVSIEWKRKFYEVGGFEAHFPVDSESLSYLLPGKIIKHGDNCGIIKSIVASESDVKVSGHDLKGLCKQRIIVPPFVYIEAPVDPLYGYDRIKGAAETAIKHYASTQLVNPTDENRGIANMTIADDLQRGDQIAWQCKFTMLDEELYSIAQLMDVGWDIQMVDGGLVFDCMVGVDRTVNQTDRAPVVFSRQWHSLNSYEYTYDAFSAVNMAYIGGDGEEEQQYITKIYDTEKTGIWRTEGYHEVSSDDVEEVDYGGEAYLKENQEKETIEGEASGSLEYKKDWNLGDYVTIRTAMGDIDKQITEVSEVYERANTKVTPTFGEKKKSKVKRR